MRKLMVLMTLALAFSLIVWTQFVAPSARANVIPADVDIDPDSLVLKEGGHGKWITVYIELPEGYDVNNINVSSVTLVVMGVHVSVSWYGIQEDELIVKFDRAFVVSVLLSMSEHMTPHVKQKVTLEVIGTLYDGTVFRGSDTIRVFSTQFRELPEDEGLTAEERGTK